MPTIRSGGDSHTVIVTVDSDKGLLPELLEHAALGLRMFANYDGFVGGALHREVEGSSLVQYLQWRDEASYRACIEDSAWDSLPSSRQFLEHVRAGRAALRVRAVDVIAVADS